jgi:hypothetical protein
MKKCSEDNTAKIQNKKQNPSLPCKDGLKEKSNQIQGGA